MIWNLNRRNGQSCPRLGIRDLGLDQARPQDWQPDESTAKDWLRNPAGEILRTERIGASSGIMPSASLISPSSGSETAKGTGLESQLLGSAGRVSRPATVKLLIFPPPNAAQRWLDKDVGIKGVCPKGMILPLAGEIGDWIEMVPCWPN